MSDETKPRQEILELECGGGGEAPTVMQIFVKEIKSSDSNLYKLATAGGGIGANNHKCPNCGHEFYEDKW